VEEEASFFVVIIIIIKFIIARLAVLNVKISLVSSLSLSLSRDRESIINFCVF